MTKDGFFYATDLDIILYVGIEDTRITKQKNSGVENKLFTIAKRGMPQKTYYKLNYETLISLFSTDKTFIEISFNRLFNHENLETPFEISENTVSRLSYTELRMMCKILKSQGLILEAENLTSTSVQKNHTLNKVSKIHKISQCVEFPPQT